MVHFNNLGIEVLNWQIICQQMFSNSLEQKINLKLEYIQISINIHISVTKITLSKYEYM